MNCFSELALSGPLLKALAAEGYLKPDAHPVARHPGAPGRPRSLRDRPDRHRQDGRLRAADARPALDGRNAARTAHLPGARDHPHPRACGADRRELSHLRPISEAHHCGGVRRRRHLAADAHAAAWRRHPGGDTGPSRRPDRAPRRKSGSRRDLRPRRSRPDARSRLHSRHPPHHRALAREAAESLLLGHHAEGDRRPCRRPAEGACPRRDRAVATTVEQVVQHVIHTESCEQALPACRSSGRSLLERTLVFTRTKHGADKVVQGPRKAQGREPRRSTATSRNPSASARSRASRRARSPCSWPPTSPRAASTSTAVSHVINYDLPHVPESYVHRIGRTARAGAGGTAIAFCAPEERPLLRDIERTIRMKLPVMTRNRSLRTPLDGERLPPRPALKQPHRQTKPARHRR